MFVAAAAVAGDAAGVVLAAAAVVFAVAGLAGAVADAGTQQKTHKDVFSSAASAASAASATTDIRQSIMYIYKPVFFCFRF
jgi:hypothetical protein